MSIYPKYQFVYGRTSPYAIIERATGKVQCTFTCKSDGIAVAQEMNGFEPVDGNEQTYVKQSAAYIRRQAIIAERKREITRLKAKAKEIDDEEAQKASLEFYSAMSTREGRRQWASGPFAALEDWFIRKLRRK